MQTRHEVEGLYNCLEFPQPVECLYQAVQTPEKIFFCFYKIFFLEKEKNTLFYMALIKREILTSLEVLYTKLVLESVLFCKKDAFENTEFSHLKCRLKRKKLTRHVFFNLFQVSWVNKVNLSSIQLKNFFK